MALKKICSHRGCTTLVESGYCGLHTKDKQAARKQYDNNRPEWHDLYNSERWRKARLHFLRLHPLCECEDCKRSDRLLPATAVDHKIPHKGDYTLFWDTNNWQAMTKRCHNRKTAKEDGGFGNPRK
ncbi:MAG: HNH endonuclease [Desulfitobacteriaceae bacterium]